ncbi:helix-turn-helix domain-containing protein [Rhodococcus ruber]
MSLDDVRAMSVAALTQVQVAQVLGVDRRTVSRAIEEGTVPAVKFGRRVLIPREPFLEMFSGQKKGVA